MSIHSISACTLSPLKGLMRNLAVPSILYSRLNLLPSGFLPRSEANIVGGKPVHSSSFIQLADWQKKKESEKAAENSSSPYLLCRTQHKSHGKSKSISLVANTETSATIIYMRFGRIKSIIFLRTQCYADLVPVVLSHSLHVQLASGVSFLSQLLIVSFHP